MRYLQLIKRNKLIPLLIYFAITVVVFSSIFTAPPHSYIGVGADPIGSMWFLGWIPYALTHGQNPLLTNWMLYGIGLNLTWNTAVPLLGVILWPITSIWGALASFNVGVFLCVFLSASFAYYAALRIVGKPLPSFVAGLIYGFSPYMFAESLGHLHLIAAFIPPLTLAAIHELVAVQRANRRLVGAAVGVLAVAQYFLSSEILATEALMAAIGIALLFWTSRGQVDRKRLGYIVGSLAVAAAVAAVLLFYPLYLQFAGPWRLHAPVQPEGVYVTDLLNFILPDRLQLLSTFGAQQVTSHFTGNESEWVAYLGIPLILLLVSAVQSMWQSRVVRFWGAMTIFAALLSMGSYLHIGGYASHVPLPWLAIQHLPVFDDVLPSRIGLYMYLFAGVLLALYLSDLAPSARSRAPRYGRYIAVALALVPLVPRLPFVTSTTTIPTFVRSRRTAVPRKRTPVFLMLPLPSTENDMPILWQAETGYSFKMFGGYGNTGAQPTHAVTKLTGYSSMLDQGYSFPPDSLVVFEMRSLLDKVGVGTIVVTPSSYQKSEIAMISSVTGSPPNYSGDVYVWQGVHRDVAALPSISVAGDFWPDGWMGRNATIRVDRVPILISLSSKWRPVSLPLGTITVTEQGGSRTTYTPTPNHQTDICVPAGHMVHIHAAGVFVPSELSNSTDSRHLSFQLAVSPIPSCNSQ